MRSLLLLRRIRRPAFEFLLSKGDKWTATDNEAVNPYRVASAFGRSDIIRILEKNNISGRQGFRIDEVSFAVSTRFNVRDFFTGAAIVFKEPMINAGFVIGCDIKPVYTRILMKTGENNYYQYFDRSSMAFAGIFKDFHYQGVQTRIEALQFLPQFLQVIFWEQIQGHQYHTGQ